MFVDSPALEELLRRAMEEEQAPMETVRPSAFAHEPAPTSPYAGVVEPPSAPMTPPAAPAPPQGAIPRTMPWQGLEPGPVDAQGNVTQRTTMRQLPILQRGNVRSIDTRTESGGPAPSMENPPQGTASWTAGAIGEVSPTARRMGLYPGAPPGTYSPVTGFESRADENARATAAGIAASSAEAEARKTQKAQQAPLDEAISAVSQILARAKVDAASWDPNERARGEATLMKAAPIASALIRQRQIGQRPAGPLAPGQSISTNLGTGVQTIRETGPSVSQPTPTHLALVASGAVQDPKLSQDQARSAQKEMSVQAGNTAKERAVGTQVGKGTSEAIAAATKYADAIRKGQALLFPQEDVEILAEGFLTPASANYGKTPSMGFGAAGQPARLQFWAAVAEKMKEPGFTAPDTVVRSSVTKGLQTELNNSQALRGKITNFMVTNDKNLELAEKISDAVQRADTPALNNLLIPYKIKVEGSADMAGLNAAIRVAINETAKVLTSATGTGVMSDESRKEMEAVLNASMNPQQVRRVISVLRMDMQNREAGFKKVELDVTNRLRELGVKSPTTSTAPPVQTPALSIPAPPNPERPRNLKVNGVLRYWDGRQWQNPK